MIRYERNDITTINVMGKEFSAIIIGPEENNLPKHLLQLERQDGMIIDGETITPFKWKGVTKDEKYQYVYFDKCNLEPFSLITTKYRNNALKLTMELAYGISKATESFLNLTNGVIPLFRIYIMDETKLLILPPDMGDMIAIARMGERRGAEDGHLIKRDTEMSYRLILEMGEILYWAATGILPYEHEDVRTCGYREVPLNWYENSLNEETEKFINSILHMKERAMRDIGGNRKGFENLGWFLKNALELEWNLPSITAEERDAKVAATEDSDDYKTYFERISKEAKTRNFWRVKGTLIVTVAAITVLLVALFGTMIIEQFKPPVTKDMSQVEFIENFYDMQDSLNAAEFETAIKTEVPQSSEVTSLFVTKQTRAAHEIYDPHVRASEWVEAGKPDVMYDSFIYGVVLEEIEQLDENKYRAKTTWYSPYDYDAKDEETYIPPDGQVVVYSYSVWQDFTFEWNDRGWWNVTELGNLHYSFIEKELVDTYPRPDESLF